MSFRPRMDFLSTYFQWFLVSLAARETRIAWREAYPDFNSLLSTSLIFFACVSFLLVSYFLVIASTCTIFWSPKSTCISVWSGLGYPKLVSNASCFFWPSLAVLFALEISYSGTGSHVLGVSLERCLASLTLSVSWHYWSHARFADYMYPISAFASLVLPFCQSAFQWLNALTTCMLASQFQYICSNDLLPWCRMECNGVVPR